MFHFLKKRIGVKGKIGVYGRSIGCTAACRLTPYCELIVADRGFDNLVDLADYKFFGSVARNLWLYMTGGWQVNNAFNYLFVRRHQSLLQNECPTTPAPDKDNNHNVNNTMGGGHCFGGTGTFLNFEQIEQQKV